MEWRICSKCKKSLPLDRFNNRKRKRSSGEVYITKHYYCRECHNEYHRKFNKVYLGDRPGLMAAYSHRGTVKLRELIFSHYGKECSACMESDLSVLAIDHINNDGAAHRKKLFGWVVGNKKNARPPSGHWLYNWIKQNGFPNTFQVLCMNCNTAKHKNGGAMPFRRIKEGSKLWLQNKSSEQVGAGNVPPPIGGK